MKIVQVGKFLHRGQYKKFIVEEGGELAYNVTRSIHYVVTTQEKVDEGFSQLKLAINSGVPMVRPQFLAECKKNHRVVDYRPFLLDPPPITPLTKSHKANEEPLDVLK